MPDDDPKRTALAAQFAFATWIADAARRASQIQVMTHALKGVHPDARGTSLYRPPSELQAYTAVGSHCLGADFLSDAVATPPRWTSTVF